MANNNFNTEIYESVIAQIAHGIVLLDSNKQIQYWNRWIEQKSGITKKEATGKLLMEVYPNANLQRIDQAITDALEKGHSSTLSQSFSNFKLDLYSNAKKSLPIIPQIYVSPLKDNDKLCLLQITDVTAAVTKERMLKSIANEAQQGRQAAENLSQLKSSFVATVSHELRTPLTSIIGSLGLIKGNVAGKLNSTQTKLIDLTHKNSELLLKLISDILDLEKIESGAIEFDFRSISITNLLKQATSGIEGYGEQLNVNFKLQLPDEDLYVYGDYGKLMQVLNNLLSNAAKFSLPGQSVTISAQTRNHYVRIGVEDHGQGIPESFKATIYDKFTQLDSRDNRNTNGTGLGLAIAKLITDKHNGKIDFHSVVGKGTTFYIDIPAASELDVDNSNQQLNNHQFAG